MKVTALVLAGGKGARMKAGKNKLFLPIGGREILHYTLSAFEWNGNVDNIILVSSPDDIDQCSGIIRNSNFKKVRAIAEGGRTRQESVMKGLIIAGFNAACDIVLIHDGARALVTDKEINEVIEGCMRYGAAAVGVKCKDTLKSVENGFITGTVDREKTYHIQTPQAFKYEEIANLHIRALEEGFKATDDSMIAGHYGVKVKIADGSYENIKLTTPEDLLVAENILRSRGEIE